MWVLCSQPQISTAALQWDGDVKKPARRSLCKGIGNSSMPVTSPAIPLCYSFWGNRVFYTLLPSAVSCSIKINGSRAGSHFVMAFQAAPALLGIRSTRIMPFNKQLIDQAGVKWTCGVLLKFLSSHMIIALYSCFAFVLWTINPLAGLAPAPAQQEGCAGVILSFQGTVTHSAFSPWSHQLLPPSILGSPSATPVTNPLEMDFQLSNKGWAHNRIFREAQGRGRGCTSFSTKIFLEEHRRYCPCFLLTHLNN